jgi:hypothetical protein
MYWASLVTCKKIQHSHTWLDSSWLWAFVALSNDSSHWRCLFGASTFFYTKPHTCHQPMLWYHVKNYRYNFHVTWQENQHKLIAKVYGHITSASCIDYICTFLFRFFKKNLADRRSYFEGCRALKMHIWSIISMVFYRKHFK